MYKLETRRIALIHDDLNLCGGAERLAISTIEALNDNDYKIFLVTRRRTDWSKIQRIFGKQVRVEREYCLPLGLNISNTYESLALVLLKLKMHQGNILIFNTKGDVIPAIWDDVTYMHTPALTVAYNTLPWRFYFTPSRLVNRALFEPRILLTNSLFSKQKIAQIFGRDAEVVYPPIDLSTHKKLLDYEESRKNIVAVVSRLSVERQLDLIPEIATSVEGRFFVMGPTERTYTRLIYQLKKQIRHLELEKKIVLCPNISHKKKLRILSKSKVFLNPACNEHFGMATVEAMAAGCIPVVLDSGGLKEFVPKRWRYKDIEEAKDKIRQAFDFWSRAEAEKISKTTDRFDEVHYQRRMLEIFDKIA